jgi:hypothetical protein
MIFALGFTRAPRRLMTTPSTLTQPFSIHSSASRREHGANSLTSFDRRGDSFARPRGGLPVAVAAAAGAEGGGARRASLGDAVP